MAANATIEISMDQFEFWLLDSAITLRYPLQILVSPDIEEHYNRDGHGLPLRQLIQVLSDLFSKGDLNAHAPNEGQADGPSFVPDNGQIEAALDGDIDLYYGLTAQGGERWERTTKPQWERYYNESSNYVQVDENLTHHVIELQSMDVRLLESRVEIEKTEVYYHSNGVEKWDILRPWQATYWKTLPQGYSLSYEYEAPSDYNFTLEESIKSYAAHQRTRNWRSSVSKWYVDPFTC